MVRELMGLPRGTHVVSLHRPTLPALLEPIVAGGNLQRHHAFASGLRTAEMFVVHVAHGEADPEVVDIERHIPYTRLSRH